MQKKFSVPLHRLYANVIMLMLVLVLAILVCVAIPVWIFGAFMVLTFLWGLLAGYSLFGAIFAFATTAATLWFCHFLYSLLRDVWAEFKERRAISSG